jgi:hypothetical protein
MTTADQLDAICKRQTGRLIDRIRVRGELTPTIEKDIVRQFGFFAQDAKQAIQGFSGSDHDRRTDR